MMLELSPSTIFCFFLQIYRGYQTLHSTHIPMNHTQTSSKQSIMSEYLPLFLSLSLCAAIFACCTTGEQIYLSISIHILTYFYPHCIYSLLLALCSMFPLKLTISLYPILLSYTFVYSNQDNIICYIYV